jgi:ABC-type amino acid transport system permease subunit
VLPALVNQFIGNVKDSSLVYFLGLLASEREIFRVGQDQAVVTGNLSPLCCWPASSISSSPYR